MNKRIILVVAILVITLLICTCLVGCEHNYRALDTNYFYNRAYIKVGEEWIDVEIKEWRDFEFEGELLQIVLKDDTVLLVNSINCTLYNGNLPEEK